MRIRAGDWVVRIEKGCDRGVLGTDPWRVRRSDDKGGLLLVRNNSTLWATSYFRLAKQEEIDSVPFKLGDYVNHSRPLNKPMSIDNRDFSSMGKKPKESVWRHATPEEFRQMIDAPLEDSRDELVDEKVDTGLLKKVLSTLNLRLCALEAPTHDNSCAYREKLSKAVVGFKVGPAEEAGRSRYTLEGFETTSLFDVALEPVEPDPEINLAYERHTSKASGVIIGKARQKKKDLKFLIFAIVASATVSALTVAGMLL